MSIESSTGRSEGYDPHSRGHGGRSEKQERRHSGVPSRSRVHQKGGERSHTYSHHQLGGRG